MNRLAFTVLHSVGKLMFCYHQKSPVHSMYVLAVLCIPYNLHIISSEIVIVEMLEAVRA